MPWEPYRIAFDLASHRDTVEARRGDNTPHQQVKADVTGYYALLAKAPDLAQFAGLAEEFKDRLAQRGGGPGESALGIRTALLRHYQTLAQDLATVSLSRDEASLLIDALNGTIIDDATYLPMEIEDSINIDGLAEKWKVDGEALVGKIQGWTPGQRLAVVDAVERFWSRSTSGENEGKLALDLAKVGLVR